MIGKTFLGTLRKFESFRDEANIYVKIIIKHTSEGAVQEFLTPFATKQNIDNLPPLFTWPVRWKKMVFDTSDFVQNTYRIKFGEVEFEAELNSITVTRKLVNGSDIFDYSLELIKPASEGLEDRVIVEAYLDYKEENDEEKMVRKDFDVNMELLEVKKSMTETSEDLL